MLKNQQSELMDMEAVKARMKERGITQKMLAEALGIHQSGVSLMLRGERGVSAKEAAIISRMLEIENVGYSPVRELPVIGRVSAGNWREAVEDATETMACPEEGISQSAFVIEVDGDSMDEIVPDGGRIVVDPTDLDLIDGKAYVVRNGDGDTTFKVFRANPARLEPCSSNPNHHTIYPGQDMFLIVGRVVWAMQRL
jgi:repressor LexA